MKNLKFFAMVLMMAAVFCMQANKASALDSVDFDFYYQSIEGVKTINEPIKEDDSLWTKVKKTVKKGTNFVKKTWENGVTRNFALGFGSDKSTWYSGEDSNIAYEVKRVKVSTEAELLSAMGVSSESEMTNGQKALLAAFRSGKSEALQSRAEGSILPKVNVILSDTTGYDDKTKYPNVRQDFWPCSTFFSINFSSNCYDYPGSEADAASTMVHEYAHCMDLTQRERNSYGLDGSHYGNEITTKRAALVEGWAEYNEMLESEKEAQGYIKQTKKLCEESKTEKGKYTNVLPADATADQLLRSEAYNATLLYYITKGIDNGQEKVLKAFTATRWNLFRDVSDLVKYIVKHNPEDAEKICKIVDDTFLGKLSDEEFFDMVGKTAETKKYMEHRGEESVEGEKVEVKEAVNAKVSTEKIKVETQSNNPFSVE